MKTAADAILTESYEDLWKFAEGNYESLDRNELLKKLERIAIPANCKERYHYAICQTPAILGESKISGLRHLYFII